MSRSSRIDPDEDSARRAAPLPDRWSLVAGALFGLTAVAAGAFGAHGLRARLDPQMLAVFETGVRYQMYHALALIACAFAAAHWPGRLWRPAAAAFVVGIVLFSGSLYALALSGLRSIGWITPIGGLAFLIGWLMLAVAGLRLSSPR